MKFCTVLFVLALIFSKQSEAQAPLRVNPENWHYFTDSAGKTIVLAGSHTWLRKMENHRWIADGWNMDKFNKYLDFLHYWNHNFTRLWMWEQEGYLNIWVKRTDGKYDLSKLNQAYFDRVRARVQAADGRGIYVGVMLFQGWSGCCGGSRADWPLHPMHKSNNVNGVDGDPQGKGFGEKVHSMDIPEIVQFQERYVEKMIQTLNAFDNVIWEIGNETIASSVPWKTHMIGFIRSREDHLPRRHLIWDSTGNGVGNDAIWITGSDVFSPCAIKGWSAKDEIYVVNPPEPDPRVKKPIILDNDHIGNHFLRFTAREQRNWTWKAFTRGNHPLHMDSYDTFWDGEEPMQDHPIPGVATNPHFDPQRKSLGDILRYAEKIDLVNMCPVTDSVICSTTFCLQSREECLIYQPVLGEGISVNLRKGKYFAETFDTIDSSTEQKIFKWNGGNMLFIQPKHVAEDWVLFIRAL